MLASSDRCELEVGDISSGRCYQVTADACDTFSSDRCQIVIADIS